MRKNYNANQFPLNFYHLFKNETGRCNAKKYPKCLLSLYYSVKKFRLIAHVTFCERTIVTIHKLKSRIHYGRLCLGIMKNIVD